MKTEDFENSVFENRNRCFVNGSNGKAMADKIVHHPTPQTPFYPSIPISKISSYRPSNSISMICSSSNLCLV